MAKRTAAAGTRAARGRGDTSAGGAVVLPRAVDGPGGGDSGVPAEAAAPPPFFVEMVALPALTELPDNARHHAADKDIPVLMASLSQFGQRKPIVVKRVYRGHANVIIAGNGTSRAAFQLGWSHIAVAWFEGTDDDADAYALVDNRTAELSEWDLQRLSAQLQAIAARDPDAVTRLGWAPHELGPLMSARFEPEAYEPMNGDGPASATARTLMIASGNWETIERAVARLREREHDDGISEGRALELICADWLS